MGVRGRVNAYKVGFVGIIAQIDWFVLLDRGRENLACSSKRDRIKKEILKLSLLTVNSLLIFYESVS